MRRYLFCATCATFGPLTDDTPIEHEGHVGTGVKVAEDDDTDVARLFVRWLELQRRYGPAAVDAD